MEEEIWKFYKETNHARWGKRVYEVSNLGRVKINGKIIEIKDNGPKSYKCIGPFRIHRAVAELFVHNPENKLEVDHIDGNIKNNRWDNLRWVTHKENMNNPISIINHSKSQKKYILEHPDAVRGKNNGMYGKKHKTESIEKNRESNRKYWKTHNHPMYGKHWYNNGIKCTLAFECPQGYTLGKL